MPHELEVCDDNGFVVTDAVQTVVSDDDPTRIVVLEFNELHEGKEDQDDEDFGVEHD